MGDRTQLTPIEREAADWLVRMDSLDATVEERREFHAWLTADPAHRRAYEDLSRTWGLLGAAKPARPTGFAAALKRPRVAVAAGIGLAAVLALVVFAIWPSSPANAPSAGPYQTYQTAAGERRALTLADGSRIELSAATQLEVAYSGRERHVALKSGTALFDVIADASRPFVVETSLGSLRVRGTSFVVQARSALVRATVLEGVVEGARGDGQAANNLQRWLGRGETVTARAHEEISLSAAEAAVAPVSAPLLARRLAWRNDMFAFNGETVREAAEEVSLHTGVRFAFADPRAGQARIVGYISASDPYAFVELLREGVGVEAEWLSETEVRLSSPARSARAPRDDAP